MKTQNDPISSVNTDVQEQDYLDSAVSPVEQAMEYNVGPMSKSERMSNGAVKGAAWLLGIVGVFALAILIAWMCNIDKSPLSSRLASSEMALKSPVKSSVQSLTTVVKTPVKEVKSLVSKVSTPTATVLPSTATASKSVSSEPAAVSQADQARIEKEALEVIHGDYGNNPGRAEKLGSDYALVQARVNQLLHI